MNLINSKNNIKLNRATGSFLLLLIGAGVGCKGETPSSKSPPPSQAAQDQGTSSPENLESPTGGTGDQSTGKDQEGQKGSDPDSADVDASAKESPFKIKLKEIATELLTQSGRLQSSKIKTVSELQAALKSIWSELQMLKAENISASAEKNNPIGKICDALMAFEEKFQKKLQSKIEWNLQSPLSMIDPFLRIGLQTYLENDKELYCSSEIFTFEKKYKNLESDLLKSLNNNALSLDEFKEKKTKFLELSQQLSSIDLNRCKPVTLTYKSFETYRNDIVEPLKKFGFSAKLQSIDLLTVVEKQLQSVKDVLKSELGIDLNLETTVNFSFTGDVAFLSGDEFVDKAKTNLKLIPIYVFVKQDHQNAQSRKMQILKLKAEVQEKLDNWGQFETEKEASLEAVKKTKEEQEIELARIQQEKKNKIEKLAREEQEFNTLELQAWENQEEQKPTEKPTENIDQVIHLYYLVKDAQASYGIGYLPKVVAHLGDRVRNRTKDLEEIQDRFTSYQKVVNFGGVLEARVKQESSLSSFSAETLKKELDYFFGFYQKSNDLNGTETLVKKVGIGGQFLEWIEQVEPLKQEIQKRIRILETVSQKIQAFQWDQLESNTQSKMKNLKALVEKYSLELNNWNKQLEKQEKAQEKALNTAIQDRDQKIKQACHKALEYLEKDFKPDVLSALSKTAEREKLITQAKQLLSTEVFSGLAQKMNQFDGNISVP